MERPCIQVGTRASTHVFLWWRTNDARLSIVARDAIAHAQVVCWGAHLEDVIAARERSSIAEHNQAKAELLGGGGR